MLSEGFKKAREHLGFTKNGIAKKAGLTHTTIGNIEKGSLKTPNWEYVEYLIENGINPYFLIGKSEEVEGQNVTGVISESEHEEVKAKLQELQTKYDIIQELLQVEVDEDGNVKKKI